MNIDLEEILYVAIITAGLVVFTYLLFVSKKKKEKLLERRERIKRKWLDRLEP